ncbi:Metalloenzyme, LuxS/M16 peptidase-like protein [Sporodiniella umbellata]|nr:Metalloenzyme, LuxS/M16 peptidase-like protein [Sporodiniella umbellata]
MLATSCKAIVNTVSKANYATAAAASSIQISSASNGVKVASSQEPGQTASLSVVVNGGARAESGKNAGVSHFLKNFGFKNNTDRTSFRIVREAELAGGVLSADVSRESLSYTAEFLKGDAGLFAEILSDVVTKQKYQEHEFVDVRNQTASESINAFADSEVTAIETAHQLAFRNGLGNSVFAQSNNHVNNQTVKAFAQQLFTQGNVALVGTGIEHDTLVNLAEQFLNLPAGSAVNTDQSKYFGGEARLSGHNNEYILAFEGASLNSAEYAALQVLRHALGGDLNIKYTTGSGLLAQAASKFNEAAKIKAFNLGYSDAGLFGVHTSGAQAGSAIAAAVEQLKAAKSLSNEDFARGVAQAKYAATAAYETRLDRLQTLGAQAFSGSKLTAAESIAAIEKVSASDVAKAVEKLLSSKPSAVAVGDLHNLPYADSVSL